MQKAFQEFVQEEIPTDDNPSSKKPSNRFNPQNRVPKISPTKNRVMGMIRKGRWSQMGGLGVVTLLVSAPHLAASMAEHATDYARFKQSGDTAFADLAAISLAVDVLTVSDDYFVTMTVLEMLLD